MAAYFIIIIIIIIIIILYHYYCDWQNILLLRLYKFLFV